jgi:hypothetical protein
VTHRDRAEAHERLGALLDVAALDLGPAQRVGPVQHHHRHPGPRRRLHAQGHGPDVGVVAAAHVLQVDQQHVDGRQGLGGRLQRLDRVAVEAGGQDAGAPVGLGLDADHVLGLAPHPVLGAEQAGRADARGDQPIDGVGQLGGDAGGVAEQPHPPALAQVQPFRAQDVQAGEYARHEGERKAISAEGSS